MEKLIFITKEQTAVNLVNELAGSHNLKKQLTKIGITYVKVERGAKVQYILRGNGISKTTVTL